jgi:hypothetical protein
MVSWSKCVASLQIIILIIFQKKNRLGNKQCLCFERLNPFSFEILSFINNNRVFFKGRNFAYF